jgi:hypothetical protein
MAYGDDFKVYGPYMKKNRRLIVIVVDKNGVRRTVSYPKYLMELQLGRQLDPNEHTVDHIDSNIDNNDLSNLRLVPREEHSADDTRRAKLEEFECAWCHNKFERSPRLIRDKAKKNRAGPFCSRKCAGKYSRMLQLKLIERLAPQQHMETQYFKRKNVLASVDFDEEVDIDLSDLIAYVEGRF